MKQQHTVCLRAYQSSAQRLCNPDVLRGGTTCILQQEHLPVCASFVLHVLFAPELTKHHFLASRRAFVKAGPCDFLYCSGSAIFQQHSWLWTAKSGKKNRPAYTAKKNVRERIRKCVCLFSPRIIRYNDCRISVVPSSTLAHPILTLSSNYWSTIWFSFFFWGCICLQWIDLLLVHASIHPSLRVENERLLIIRGQNVTKSIKIRLAMEFVWSMCIVNGCWRCT